MMKWLKIAIPMFSIFYFLQVTTLYAAEVKHNVIMVRGLENPLPRFKRQLKLRIKRQYRLSDEAAEKAAWLLIARFLRTRTPIDILIRILERVDVGTEYDYWRGFFGGDLDYWRGYCSMMGCNPVIKMCEKCSEIRHDLARDACFGEILREGYRCF